MAAEDVAQTLERLLAGVVVDALVDPGTTDVHVNPDGEAFACSSKGRRRLGRVEESVVRRALQVIAHERGGELRRDLLFQGELPEGEPFRGARVQAVLPPVAKGAAMSIRMHSKEIFELDAFAATARAMGKSSAPLAPDSSEGTTEVLLRAALERENVVFYGGTGSGKTSVLNALLGAVAKERRHERVVVLEDTFEVSRTHVDQVAMRTEESGGIELHDLVRASLRMQPDRIVVGEVRGPEALDLIDAWSTGHTGGLATVHASSALGALLRLEHLARRHPRAGGSSLREYIAAAVGVVVGMRIGRNPYLGSVERVELASSGEYFLEPY